MFSTHVQNDISHFVIASSSEVYGEPSINPVHEGAETKGKTVYAVSKMAAEELAKGYHQIHPKLNYTVVRFFNTYGEGQVAQFVISRFVKRVLEGLNPQVYGEGAQTRSFCHVTDVVEGLREILERPLARNRVYNIGNSKEVYSLIELAQKVIDVLKAGFWAVGRYRAFRGVGPAPRTRNQRSLLRQFTCGCRAWI